MKTKTLIALTESQHKRYSEAAEKALFVTLCGLGLSCFISSWGVSRFSAWSLYILIIWRFFIGYEPERKLPRPLVWMFILSLLSYLVSSFISADKSLMIRGLKDHRVFLLAGLLISAPLRNEYRRIIIIIYFAGALAGGLIGVLQYYDLFPNIYLYGRATGYAQHPVIYATQVALAGGVGIVLLSSGNRDLLRSKLGTSVVIVSTFFAVLGMLYGQSRGVWLAFLFASVIAVSLYNPRRAMVFIVASFLVIGAIALVSAPLKQRFQMTVASIIDPNSDPESSGNRIKLWEGAIAIFQEEPLWGTGTGDYQEDMDRLAKSGKIGYSDPHTRGNAHSSYFHVLATQGMLGIATLVGLYLAVLHYGYRLTRERIGLGGYVIIHASLILIVGGTTVAYISGLGMGLILSQYCFIFGVFGPMKSGENRMVGT